MPRLLNVEDDGGGKVRRKVKGRGGSAEIESAVLVIGTEVGKRWR